MSKEGKSTSDDKRMRQVGAVENGFDQRGAARPESEARTWAAFNKLHGGGKKFGTGRKVPSGPVGGSGRKTNLARSS